MTINNTSNRRTVRTIGRFTVQAPWAYGSWNVYPVYLTADLEALAEHPLFWDDPTIDYNTRSIAAIYLRPTGEVGSEMSIETLDWSAEADTFGGLIEKLEAHLKEGK